MRRPCTILAVICVCLVSLSVFRAARLSTRGIHPTLLERYVASLHTREWACPHGDPELARDGQSFIPITRVNDDYCDCDDGSDEPSTGACASGTFYCRNEGHKPQVISASKVNDHICDCCDGADEWRSPNLCANTCDEKGREAREAVFAALQAARAGNAQLKALVEQSESQLAVLRTELAGLEPLLHQATQDAADAKQVYDQTKARAEETQQAEAAKAEIAAAATGSAPATAPDPTQSPSDGGAGMTQSRRVAVTNSGAQDEVEVQHWMRMEGMDSDPTPEAAPVDVEDVNDDVQVVDEEAPPAISEEEQAKQLYDERKKSLDELTRKHRELTEKLEADYGPDHRLFALRSDCAKFTTPEYEYSVCPYRDVVQKEIRGGRSTVLGRWKGWAKDYTRMSFTGGERCWGGPDRECEVTVQCGMELTVRTVEEPNRCLYTATIAAPVFCDDTLVKRLEQEASSFSHRSQTGHAYGDEIEL